MSEPVVAVIDIGKTNKKIHIYNRELDLVDSCSRPFEPFQRDGVAFENTDDLMEWLLDSLGKLASRHDIRTIATTTHGAAFACVDKDGELTIPIVDYTHEPGESFHDQFYSVAGNKADLQRSTATLELKALVNPGKGIYFLKERFPEDFARTTSILMYDQYFPMKLSNARVADPTYLGCHTYLFDHQRIGYSDVVNRLGLGELMPDVIKNPGEVAGTILPEVAGRTGISPLATVLVGIHDSNASLIPYLLQSSDQDFIVNSTGTWCVAMHPEPSLEFAEDEIGKAVFYNMSAFRDPVKTTILMAGQEFETFTDTLHERTGLSGFPAFNPGLYQDIISRKKEFFLPAILAGTGQFPDSRARVIDGTEVIPWEAIAEGTNPALFRDPERAYAVLNLSLALQSVVALRRVGLTNGTTVFTEGGFRNNRDYNALLCALCPEADFYLSGMPEATSFGTALLGWAALEGVGVHDLADRFQIDREPVQPAALEGLVDYADAFFELLG